MLNIVTIILHFPDFYGQINIQFGSHMNDKAQHPLNDIVLFKAKRIDI